MAPLMKMVQCFSSCNIPRNTCILAFIGWEYCVEAGLGGWVSSERNVHMCRRRRWVRTRIRVHDPRIAEKKVKSVEVSKSTLVH